MGALLLVALGGCSESDAPEANAVAQRRSVVLIVLDTVRADHLRSYGYERPTSPHLERWAQHGALFENAIASSSWTLPSFASIYTGHHPGRHGAGERFEHSELRISGIAEDLPTLAERFREAGYATIAFATNPFLHRKFGVDRGFDEYSFVPASNRDIRDAETTVDLALAWFDQQSDRPCFAMIHLFDPHMDYFPPEDIRGKFTEGYEGPLEFPVTGGARIRSGILRLDAADEQYVIGSYDEELVYLDRELGRLLDGLAERELLEEGVVILTSDHGEEFFEHGSFEHGHAAYQELLHVPLVIWGESVQPSRISQPVSHVDLFPTALDAAGLEIPDDLPGVSLLPAARAGTPIEPRPLIADRTLHDRRHRVLIRWPWKAIDVEGRRDAMLFHLEDDPHERNDLSKREPDRLQAMLKEFEVISPTTTRSEDQQEAEALDDAIREQLEALGYAKPRESAADPESEKE